MNELNRNAKKPNPSQLLSVKALEEEWPLSEVCVDLCAWTAEEGCRWVQLARDTIVYDVCYVFCVNITFIRVLRRPSRSTCPKISHSWCRMQQIDQS